MAKSSRNKSSEEAPVEGAPSVIVSEGLATPKGELRPVPKADEKDQGSPALERLKASNPKLYAKKLAEKTASPDAPAKGNGNNLTFRTFLSSSGIKPDQLAGFSRWVTSRENPVMRRTRPEWEAMLSEFQNTPLVGAKTTVRS